MFIERKMKINLLNIILYIVLIDLSKANQQQEFPKNHSFSSGTTINFDLFDNLSSRIKTNLHNLNTTQTIYTLSIIFTIIGTLLLIIYIYEKSKSYSIKSVIIKSFLSLLFISVVACGIVYSSQKGHFIYPVFVLIGLTFGLLGDIWLDFKYVFPSFSKPFTYAGFFVFGLQHILIFIGLIIDIKNFNIIKIYIVGFIIGYVGANGEKIMKVNYKEYKYLCYFYSSILTGNVFATGNIYFQYDTLIFLPNEIEYNNKLAWKILFVGYVLFILSDTILCQTYFSIKGNRETTFWFIGNYVCYYGAQFCIAWSLLFL